jgi:hypothetical protein
MKSILLPALLLCSACAMAQTAVDIAADPHYHMLLENHQVRVFAVTFGLTEKAYVRHEHNYLVVTLRDCELVMWGKGTSAIQNFRFSRGDVSFFLGEQEEGIRNDRSAECQYITVEFLNPKVTGYRIQSDTGWSYIAGGINAPADPHVKFANGVDLGAAAAQDVQLLAGDSLPPPGKPAAELLILISDVDLRKPDDSHIRKSVGEAVWIVEGRKSELTNASNNPARFAVVDLWIQPAE